MRWSATRGSLLLALGMLPVLGGCLPAQEPTDSTEALALYPRPKAAFDVRWLDTDTVELNASRSLSARGGRIVQYRWSLGDGHRIYTPLHVVQHRYELPGRFTISLVVFDETQQTASAQQVIHVVPEGDIPFEAIHEGYSHYGVLPSTGQVEVVRARNPAEFQRLWVEVFGGLQERGGPPSVNFSNEMVVALIANDPSARLEVHRLGVREGRLEVEYTRVRLALAPGCHPRAAPPHPSRFVVILRVPRVDLPLFSLPHRRTEYVPC